MKKMLLALLLKSFFYKKEKVDNLLFLLQRSEKEIISYAVEKNDIQIWRFIFEQGVLSVKTSIEIVIEKDDGLFWEFFLLNPKITLRRAIIEFTKRCNLPNKWQIMLNIRSDFEKYLNDVSLYEALLFYRETEDVFIYNIIKKREDFHPHINML